jgi:ribosomal protein S18 acetylase RimI-like enzyme
MIRLYQESDFYDIAFLDSIGYARPCSRDELKKALRGPTWVALDGDSVIGFLISSTELDKALIWSVVTSPNRRKKGVAAQLIAEAEKFYAGKELYLYVDVNNPAQKLYFDCGFRSRAILKKFYGDLDAIEMAKEAQMTINH